LFVLTLYICIDFADPIIEMEMPLTGLPLPHFVPVPRQGLEFHLYMV